MQDFGSDCFNGVCEQYYLTISKSIFDCINMLRRFNKQSCRNSLEPIPQASPSSLPFQKQINTPVSRQPQGHSRKPLSSFCSPQESPLCVKKESLRTKEKEPIVIVREPRVRLKQKTEHFNFKYLEWMRMRKQGVSWVEFNMALGIALLWKKVQQQITHFQQTRNIKYNQNFEQQVNSITQQIDSIIQQTQNKTPVPLKQDFYKLFSGRDSAQLMSSISTTLGKADKKMSQSIFFQNHYKSKHHSRKNGSRAVEGNTLSSTAAASPNKGSSLGHLKESVCKLNSYFCLFNRRITMRKEDRLIGEFMQRRSSQGSLTPNQLQQLQQIMRINQDRCRLMNQIISNVGVLRSQESNILMSQKLLKKIGQIDLIKQLSNTPQVNREEVLKAKMSSFNNIIIEVVQPQSQHPNQVIEKQESKTFFDSSEMNVAKIKSRKPFQRSSIDNFISNSKQNYENIPSKVVIAWKDRNNMKSQKIVKQKMAEKDSSHIKNAGFKRFAKIDGKQKKNATKKVIAFAINDDPKPADTRNFKSKKKSTKSLKSKKEITWEDLQRGNFRSLKSCKSLKSLKSLKSIGSYSSIGSRKFLRSLKTQREMKYLHGHKRDISYISKYRTKLFKLNGLQDENPNQVGDFHDATTERQLQSHMSDQISIELDHKPRESIELAIVEPTKQQAEPPVQTKSVVSQAKSIKKKKISIQTNELFSDQSCEKEALLRQFLMRFQLIQRQKNLAKQKSLVLMQLQKMMDCKIITQSMYDRYKAYFQGQRRKLLRWTEKASVESESNLRFSLYTNLLQFRQMISATTELNQINKYYYNIGQFKSEEEQIKMTKQANKRDDFFFNIRSTVEQQQRNIRESEHSQGQKRQWKVKVLLQKAL